MRWINLFTPHNTDTHRVALAIGLARAVSL